MTAFRNDDAALRLGGSRGSAGEQSRIARNDSAGTSGADDKPDDVHDRHAGCPGASGTQVQPVDRSNRKASTSNTATATRRGLTRLGRQSRPGRPGGGEPAESVEIVIWSPDARRSARYRRPCSRRIRRPVPGARPNRGESDSPESSGRRNVSGPIDASKSDEAHRHCWLGSAVQYPGPPGSGGVIHVAHGGAYGIAGKIAASIPLVWNRPRPQAIGRVGHHHPGGRRRPDTLRSWRQNQRPDVANTCGQRMLPCSPLR